MWAAVAPDHGMLPLASDGMLSRYERGPDEAALALALALGDRQQNLTGGWER